MRPYSFRSNSITLCMVTTLMDLRLLKCKPTAFTSRLYHLHLINYQPVYDIAKWRNK